AVHVPDDTAAAPGVPWGAAVAEPAPLPARAPDGGELWIYTGGTTGRPRAVRWDVEDMFEAQMVPTYAMAQLPFPRTLDEAVAIAVDPATPHVVNLPLAPFMHGTALTTSLNTLVLGGTVLTTSSAWLDAPAAVAFANAQGATRVIVAGDSIALPFVEAAEQARVGLPTVRMVQSSGMRFSPEVKRRLHALGTLTIFDMLASTEGGLFAVTTTTGERDLPGRPRLTPTAAVIDAQGREVQDRPGALGILAQRGALPLGYHGDEQKTRETFPVIDGVRHVMPGDWVRVLEDRHIEFMGRGSGVINTGGEKVYPQEVEDALLSYPGVSDAAVIGTPDDRFGEIVTAVVARTDPSVTADVLIAHVGGVLAGYKKPRHIVFRDSLERSPTGKVPVSQLREAVRSHLHAARSDRKEQP
ncbi:MAG: AMP-binding protein, partial [Microbacterium sp.]